MVSRRRRGEGRPPLSDPDAREIVYGMPYDEWRKKYQKEATAEQKARFCRERTEALTLT